MSVAGLGNLHQFTDTSKQKGGDEEIATSQHIQELTYQPQNDGRSQIGLVFGHLR